MLAEMPDGRIALEALDLGGFAQSALLEMGPEGIEAVEKLPEEMALGQQPLELKEVVEELIEEALRPGLGLAPKPLLEEVLVVGEQERTTEVQLLGAPQQVLALELPLEEAQRQH